MRSITSEVDKFLFGDLEAHIYFIIGTHILTGFL